VSNAHGSVYADGNIALAQYGHESGMETLVDWIKIGGFCEGLSSSSS
jgi:hypothetical protein